MLRMREECGTAAREFPFQADECMSVMRLPGAHRECRICAVICPYRHRSFKSVSSAMWYIGQKVMCVNVRPNPSGGLYPTRESTVVPALWGTYTQVSLFIQSPAARSTGRPSIPRSD